MKATLARYSKSILTYYKSHKIIGTIIALVILSGGYYAIKNIFSSGGETQYVLARATFGNIETTVAGTGQVAATNQIDIKAKASGDVTYVGAVAGQNMKAGQVIARLDTTDAAIALKNAQISLAKLTRPVEQSTLLSSQNSLKDAENQKTEAEADILKSYEDAKRTIATTYLDMSEIVASIDDLFYDRSGFLHDINISQYSTSIRASRDDAGLLFDNASKKISQVQDIYKTHVQTNDPDQIESLINDTYSALSTLADALKKTKLVVDSIKNSVTNNENTSASTAAQTNVSGWTSKVNNHLTNLISAKTTIKNARNSLESATRTIAQRKENLADIVEGTDALDIESQRLNVQQKLADYEKYIIRAPFDGILASMNVKKGDSVSGVTVGTFITKQKVAEISLNEIDAAKIIVGQPATLTFDAVEDLTATGTVASIDLIGTVTQGVVNYTVKIAFDIQDERIKPGMSVSANIITSSKKDVLLVPSTAVKTRGNQTYVEVAEFNGSSTTQGRQFTNQTAISLPTPPTQVIVNVGMKDNTQTEILSGLTEGQFVVSKTVSGSSTTNTATQSGGLFNIGGSGRSTGGGNFRSAPAR